jgi:hypothetical protein
MRAKRRWPIIVAGMVILLIALLAASEYANRRANFAFGHTAERYDIKGKSEDFVLEHFGRPNFITHSGTSDKAPYHVLVYIPWRWCAYPSYCKITIEEKTKTVSAWMMNSD